jgi:hypothetical protein
MKFNYQVELQLALYKRLTAKFPDRNIQPSWLRTEQTLLNGTNKYTFPTDPNSSSQLSTERRLNNNDLFIAYQIGFFLYERSTVTVAAGNQLVKPLQTFPNAQAFTGAGFTVTDLNAVYNGSLNIVRDTIVDLESFDMRNFLEIGTTQQSAATNYSEVIGTDSGFAFMTPAIVIPGSSLGSTEISVNYPQLPSNIAWQNTGASLSNQLVMFTRGYLIKNATKDVLTTTLDLR